MRPPPALSLLEAPPPPAARAPGRAHSLQLSRWAPSARPPTAAQPAGRRPLGCPLGWGDRRALPSCSRALRVPPLPTALRGGRADTDGGGPVHLHPEDQGAQCGHTGEPAGGRVCGCGLRAGCSGHVGPRPEWPAEMVPGGWARQSCELGSGCPEASGVTGLRMGGHGVPGASEGDPGRGAARNWFENREVRPGLERSHREGLGRQTWLVGGRGWPCWGCAGGALPRESSPATAVSWEPGVVGGPHLWHREAS